MKLIEIKHISAAYDGKQVIEDVSFDVMQNDFLVITGPNGGGKTTLLKLLLGLLRPSDGEILYFRNGVAVPSLHIGYLPQMSPFDRQFPVSVYDVVASGLVNPKHPLRRLSPVQHEQIAAALATVGLEGLAKKAIGELSGGQFQRTLLARAMLGAPEALLLDEPDTYLDKEFETHFIELLHQANSRTAIVVVSHDTATLTPIARRVITINKSIV